MDLLPDVDIGHVSTSGRQGDAYTGDTRMVPLLQGEMARAKVGEGVVAPGKVTVAISDDGQLVSVPTGTSEYW